jgi:hypothetical protein
MTRMTHFLSAAVLALTGSLAAAGVAAADEPCRTTTQLSYADYGYGDPAYSDRGDYRDYRDPRDPRDGRGRRDVREERERQQLLDFVARLGARERADLERSIRLNGLDFEQAQHERARLAYKQRIRDDEDLRRLEEKQRLRALGEGRLPRDRRAPAEYGAPDGFYPPRY